MILSISKNPKRVKEIDLIFYGNKKFMQECIVQLIKIYFEEFEVKENE